MRNRFLILAIIFSLSLIITIDAAYAAHNEQTSRELGDIGFTVSDSNVYVVWSDSTNPNYWDVYFAKSTDGGRTFDSAINLTNGSSFYPRAQVIASKNNVYVMWEDRISPEGIDSIFFTKSNDGGNTFDDVISLNPIQDGENLIFRPRTMFEFGDTLYIFLTYWNMQTQQNTLSFITSKDHGNSFSAPTVVFEQNQWEDYVDFSLSDSIIYVLADDKNDYDEIGDLNLRKIFSDGSLSEITKVNDGKTAATTAQLSVSGDNVYVFWRAWENGRWHPLFARSIDGGNTFGNPLVLDADPKSIDTVWSLGHHVFSHDDSVYVIWPEEYWDGVNQSFKTWFAKSNDSGDTFDIMLHPLNEKFFKRGEILMAQHQNDLYFMAMTYKNPPYDDSAIFISKSNDGMSFTEPVDLLSENLKKFGYPQVAIDTNGLHIVGQGDFNFHCVLYLGAKNKELGITSVWSLSPNGIHHKCLGLEESVLTPKHQLSMGTNREDIVCKQDLSKGYILALRKADEHPVCVTENSYGKLIAKGWLLEDSHERLALFAAENFIKSSPTFSLKGLADSLELEISEVRRSIPPIVTIKGKFQASYSGYGNTAGLEIPAEKTFHDIIIEVAQINKIHSAVLDETWDEIRQDYVANQSKEFQTEFYSSPTTRTILTIGDKISPSEMIPVSITEISEKISDTITFWQFQPIGYNGDNRGKSWDFLPNEYTSWEFLDENGNNPWDESKMPSDMFAIPADLHIYPVYCDGKERIEGESGHPSTIPIKLGTNTVYTKSGSRGILPDSDGIYTIKFVSLFNTTVEFPNNAEIMTNEIKLCVFEQTREDATHAYYTKLVFKLPN